MAAKKTRPTAEQLSAAEEQIVEQSKRIDFFLTEYSVEMLAAKYRTGEYVVPAYQRAFTWEPARKSRFIESLVMGLPIPFMFFWEMPDGKLEIVDGSQRLRTMAEFLDNDLRLTELESLTRLSGLRFSDLSPSRQRKIKNRSVRGIVLNEHADEAARLDMFDRINTGSKIANSSEIRRGVLQGPFLDLVSELANNSRLIDLAPMTAKAKKERGYEELVTRFFAYGDGLDDYKDRPAEFLFRYARNSNTTLAADPAKTEQLREDFMDMLDFVEKKFPYGFRRSVDSKFTPRTRFEAISLGVAKALHSKPKLSALDQKALGIGDWLESEEFSAVTGSDGANAIGRLRSRIDFVASRLESRIGE